MTKPPLALFRLAIMCPYHLVADPSMCTPFLILVGYNPGILAPQPFVSTLVIHILNENLVTSNLLHICMALLEAGTIFFGYDPAFFASTIATCNANITTHLDLLMPVGLSVRSCHERTWRRWNISMFCNWFDWLSSRHTLRLVRLQKPVA